MIRVKRRRKATDRGAAMVEFAILLPVLLLVIAGIVDFGRAFFTQVALTNAAREGARYAVVNSSATTADVLTRTQASAPGLANGVTATITLCAGGGTNASVTATNQFTWIALGPAMNLVGGASALPATLSSTAVMRCGG